MAKNNELTRNEALDAAIAGVLVGVGVLTMGWGWFAAGGFFVADAFVSLYRRRAL